MTFAEHESNLLNILDSMPDDACGDWRESIAYAVDIFRKYREVTKILTDDSYYEDYGTKAETFMVSAIVDVIGEVDNGNDD